ncbi:hypothetical protein ABLN67_17950, partial [Mycobacterium tuberculosis]
LSVFSYRFGCLTVSSIGGNGFRIYRETLSRFSCAASVRSPMSPIVDLSGGPACATSPNGPASNPAGAPRHGNRGRQGGRSGR